MELISLVTCFSEEMMALRLACETEKQRASAQCQGLSSTISEPDILTFILPSQSRVFIVITCKTAVLHHYQHKVNVLSLHSAKLYIGKSQVPG